MRCKFYVSRDNVGQHRPQDCSAALLVAAVTTLKPEVGLGNGLGWQCCIAVSFAQAAAAAVDLLDHTATAMCVVLQPYSSCGFGSEVSGAY